MGFHRRRNHFEWAVPYQVRHRRCSRNGITIWEASQISSEIPHLNGKRLQLETSRESSWRPDSADVGGSSISGIGRWSGKSMGRERGMEPGARSQLPAQRRAGGVADVRPWKKPERNGAQVQTLQTGGISVGIRVPGKLGQRRSRGPRRRRRACRGDPSGREGRSGLGGDGGEGIVKLSMLDDRTS